MNNKTKKLLFAVLAVAGMSGCASTQFAERASMPAAASPAAAAVPVSRPSSYGSLGGYRYRRFTSVAGA
ncbi:MAG: hypothetical protein ACRET8_12180 [Burkholderiales bacterium]